MTEFLTYDLKVAVLIAVFYFCYRLLMERETFHRLNRIVLLSSIALSLVLPLCVITFHETVEVEQTTATANPNPQSPITDMSAVTAADSVQMAPVDQSAVIFAIFRVEFYSSPRCTTLNSTIKTTAPRIEPCSARLAPIPPQIGSSVSQNIASPIPPSGAPTAILVL